MPLFSLRLNDNEEVLAIIRRHPVTFLGTFFRFLVIASIILSFHFFIPEFKFKLAASVTFGILALIYLGYRFLVWYLVNIVITSQRIIDINQKGFTKRIVTEVSLEDISRISSFKEGLFQSLFNVGSLVIEVKEGGKIVGLYIKKPEDLMTRINQLRRSYDQAAPDRQPPR